MKGPRCVSGLLVSCESLPCRSGPACFADEILMADPRILPNEGEADVRIALDQGRITVLSPAASPAMSRS